MPTYGYECLGCHAQFETVQSIKDNALTTCETCGGALRKRIYPVGIAFKGSGFYVNDYAPKSGETSSAPKAEVSPTADAKAADTAPSASASEAPKAETPKTETPKAETPKASPVA